jgi:uroporphyrinogen-III decarboxylase
MRVFERVFDFVTVDNLAVHEDMAGKSVALAGPSQIREFIAPYYLKIWNECRLNGTKLFSQDSDGNMNGVIDEFLEAGVNVMYPFEPNSGMDIVKSRKKYGKKLAFKGGLDKFALLGGKEDIKRELEYKICGETTGGGTVFALDHRIPNGVPIENYRHYAKLGGKMLGHTVNNSPFVRMAF